MNHRQSTCLNPCMVLVATMAAVLMCVFSALAAPVAPAPAPVEGVDWYLSVCQGTPIIPDSGVTLRLTDGRLGGNGGINQYFGSYKLDGNKIATSDLGMTKMAGPGPLMIQESTYVHALSLAATFRVSATTLELADATGKVVAVFGKQPVTLKSLVEGRTWVLTSYDSQTPLADSQVTLAFEEDRVGGSAGVNQYSGVYVYRDSELTISRVVATKRAGDPALMKQEAAYLSLLNKAQGVRVGPSDLRLTDAVGRVLLRFSLLSQKPGTEPVETPPVAPVLTSPNQGDRVGRSVQIAGHTGDGRPAVIAVITDTYYKGSTLVGSVPGIRHRTRDTGEFSFRVATPSVGGASDREIRYMIRVFEVRADGTRGPEATVRVYPE
ncbi:MAG: META domain-containing protein [Armatimonadia bacterium]